MFVKDEELCKKCQCNDCNVKLKIAINSQPTILKCRICCADCKRDGQLICVECVNKR